jgi:hypothetical protein
MTARRQPESYENIIRVCPCSSVAKNLFSLQQKRKKMNEFQRLCGTKKQLMIYSPKGTL